MSTTETRTYTYPCGLCGRRGKAEAMHYSRHSGNRYCLDWSLCDRRRKRKEGAK